MNVLVLNCGSSSVKYKLFQMPEGKVLAQGGVEKLGLSDSFLKLKLPSGEKVVLEKDMPEHTVAIDFILKTITVSRASAKSMPWVTAWCMGAISSAKAL